MLPDRRDTWQFAARPASRDERIYARRALGEPITTFTQRAYTSTTSYPQQPPYASAPWGPPPYTGPADTSSANYNTSSANYSSSSGYIGGGAHAPSGAPAAPVPVYHAVARAVTPPIAAPTAADTISQTVAAAKVREQPAM